MGVRAAYVDCGMTGLPCPEPRKPQQGVGSAAVPPLVPEGAPVSLPLDRRGCESRRAAGWAGSSLGEEGSEQLQDPGTHSEGKQPPECLAGTTGP